MMCYMYFISGQNSAYFFWSCWPEAELRKILKDGETLTKCDPAYAFGVRYGCQPIYDPYTYTDAVTGLERVAFATLDRKELKADLGITEGRNFW